jgi:hypothetical protein
MSQSILRSTASRITFAKAHEGTAHEPKHDGAGDPASAPGPASEPASALTIAQTIAGIDVSLPIRFTAGHTLNDQEAKVIDAAFRRQYANNMNATHKAWEEKVKKAGSDEKALEAAGSNPCTADKLVAGYTSYVPSVGASQETALEKARKEAGVRRLVELIDEHNAIVAAGGRGMFGTEPQTMPKGKGAAEIREALVTKIFASTKQAPHIQRHIDTILAEKGATKDTPANVKALTADVSFDD